MNVHESEKLAGILEVLGYSAEENIKNADIIVFNTCCIRDNAEQRAFGNIGALKPLKKQKPELIIAVCGCMTQQIGVSDVIKSKFPFVDIVLGTLNLSEFSEAVQKVIEKRQKTYSICSIDTPQIDEDLPKFRTSGTNAWVNIIYGCNNFCTYCIVPYVRGRERSREKSLILNEVKSLLDSGYKEITLLGQNVNSYGNDLNEKGAFSKLIYDISKLDYKFRLRFMTSHPKDFNREVVEVMNSSPNICNYLHLPVQSGSNDILKKMNRRYTREKYFELIDMAREIIPNIGITSDIMVGFPGETDKDFYDTIDLVKKVRFSNAFTFVYSPRQGTAAAKMEQLSDEVKTERIKELVKLQNTISKEISDTYIDTVEEVLVEDKNPKYEGVLCGRTGSGRLVNFKGEESLIGTFQNIYIEKTRSASLWGRLNG